MSTHRRKRTRYSKKMQPPEYHMPETIDDMDFALLIRQKDRLKTLLQVETESRDALLQEVYSKRKMWHSELLATTTDLTLISHLVHLLSMVTRVLSPDTEEVKHLDTLLTEAVTNLDLPLPENQALERFMTVAEEVLEHYRPLHVRAASMGGTTLSHTAVRPGLVQLIALSWAGAEGIRHAEKRVWKQRMVRAEELTASVAPRVAALRAEVAAMKDRLRGQQPNALDTSTTYHARSRMASPEEIAGCERAGLIESIDKAVKVRDAVIAKIESIESQLAGDARMDEESSSDYDKHTTIKAPKQEVKADTDAELLTPQPASTQQDKERTLSELSRATAMLSLTPAGVWEGELRGELEALRSEAAKRRVASATLKLDKDAAAATASTVTATSLVLELNKQAEELLLAAKSGDLETACLLVDSAADGLSSLQLAADSLPKPTTKISTASTASDDLTTVLTAPCGVEQHTLYKRSLSKVQDACAKASHEEASVSREWAQLSTDTASLVEARSKRHAVEHSVQQLRVRLAVEQASLSRQKTALSRSKVILHRCKNLVKRYGMIASSDEEVLRRNKEELQSRRVVNDNLKGLLDGCVDEDRLIQLKTKVDELKNMLKCSVCRERPVSHVIRICGHVYCLDCLEKNISTRNRNCPDCGKRFDRSDVMGFITE
eukprot:gnl/Dysnectes_brevis/2241_a2620_980.p1 GENE.gnl/Dysnectes_brevis/2241_a2620_980~~gnl/Dysnectes_brevis/2241_a2620_980.p1  ORF type:complete len:664 (+),score=164.09 gnl/Dysnectes_brevis/2241_a2620_980:101-2092(+)